MSITGLERARTKSIFCVLKADASLVSSSRLPAMEVPELPWASSSHAVLLFKLV